ncbi:hypothetical protein [Nannocystis bainbridge]|uniref:Lipoprotein n=1 Tax=Nannocystis bainbridge TaxID=2995303 RepID=A0ABT5E3E1_9BACT|nr:hypothetical protein [Nannocystis bainbridge]MDC0720387.1 hypothetical protein [Nannocystis bainbridge]
MARTSIFAAAFALLAACAPTKGEGTDSDTTSDTDTFEPCPAADPAVEAASFTYTDAMNLTGSHECSVTKASNAAGKVSLEMMCADKQVSLDLTVPADFKLGLDGLTDVQLDIVRDDFLAGMFIALRDLASGDLVLAAQEFNGLTVSSEDLVPLSASLDSAGCGSECRQEYAFTFTHPDGPAVTIASGNRGSLSAGGRDYDILVVGAILNGCEEHSDVSEFVIGSVPSA